MESMTFEEAIASLTEEQIKAIYERLPTIKYKETLSPSVHFVLEFWDLLELQADARGFKLDLDNGENES